MYTDADKLMILMMARRILAEGWCQGAQARRFDGEATSPTHKHAIEHCLLGAVSYAAGIDWIPTSPKRFVNGGVIVLPITRTDSEGLAFDVIELLAGVLDDPVPLLDGMCRLAHWNDEDGRKHSEVLDLFDRAIASLMKKDEAAEVARELEPA